MFFHLTWIKDISEKNYTIELLVEGEDSNTVKSFLTSEKIIVLWLDPYEESPQNFWDFYLDIQGKDWVFRIVWKEESLEWFVNYISRLKVTIVWWNSFSSPVLPQQVQHYIQAAAQAEEKKEQEIKGKKAEEDKRRNATYKDERLWKAYDAIDEVVNQIDQIMAVWWDKIEPATRKKFDDTRWEIAKLHLATNYDKIIEELHKAMNLVIETQDFLLDKLEAASIYPVIPEGQVTNVEVIREQVRLSKARLLSTLWAPLTTVETSYITFWYARIFSEYLLKDFRQALKNKLAIAQNFFEIAEFLLLFAVLEMAILSVFSEVLGMKLTLQRFWIIFIYLIVLARLFRIVNEYIRPQKVIYYIIWLILIALLYVGIMSVFKVILVF